MKNSLDLFFPFAQPFGINCAKLRVVTNMGFQNVMYRLLILDW